MTPILNTAEAIGEEIARRLALCTQVAGAESNLGAKVYRGRRKVDDTMIPCVSLIEADDKPTQKGTGTSVEVAQHYVMFAYVPCDPSDPNTAAHAAIRDMKRAIFRTGGHASATWDRAVVRVHYLGRDIGPRADGAAFVVAAIEVSVEFIEDLASP